MDSRIAQMLSEVGKKKLSLISGWRWLKQVWRLWRLRTQHLVALSAKLGLRVSAHCRNLNKAHGRSRPICSNCRPQLDIAQQRARSSGSRAKSIPATALTNAYTMVTDAQERLNNASKPRREIQCLTRFRDSTGSVFTDTK